MDTLLTVNGMQMDTYYQDIVHVLLFIKGLSLPILNEKYVKPTKILHPVTVEF